MDAVADLADALRSAKSRSHEQNLILRDVRQARSVRAVARLVATWSRDAEHRPAHRHRLLPGRRLLLARQREVDPDRRSDPAPLRRPRLPARHRRDRSQHVGLHERVRPAPHRSHRRPRRRQERRASGTRCRSAARRATEASLGKVIGPSFAAHDMPDVVARLIEPTSTIATRTSGSSTPCAGSASTLSRNASMPRLIRKRALVDEDYMLLRDAKSLADVPDGRRSSCRSRCGLERRGALIARGEIGVWLAPADDPARSLTTRAPAGNRDRLSAVHRRPRLFARAAAARALHYAGELRAIGDVARDQLYYLAQCGFDAFLLPDGRDAGRALAPSPISATATSRRRHAHAVVPAPAGGRDARRRVVSCA